MQIQWGGVHLFNLEREGWGGRFSPMQALQQSPLSDSVVLPEVLLQELSCAKFAEANPATVSCLLSLLLSLPALGSSLCHPLRTELWTADTPVWLCI